MKATEPTLSHHQVRILAEGILQKGRISAEFVERLYASGDATAKSSLMALESWGYIVAHPEVVGWFLVLKAPDEAWIVSEKMKEARIKADKILKKGKKMSI